MSNDSTLWLRFYPGIEFPLKLSGNDCTFINQDKFITSVQQLKVRIIEFVKNTPLNEKHIFSCTFNGHPTWNFSLILSSEEKSGTEVKPDLDYKAFFTKKIQYIPHRNHIYREGLLYRYQNATIVGCARLNVNFPSSWDTPTEALYEYTKAAIHDERPRFIAHNF